MNNNTSATGLRQDKWALRAMAIVGLLVLGSGPGMDGLIPAASAQQSFEITNWTMNKSATGVTELTDARTTNSRTSLHISSNARSTAWAESSTFRTALPYTVSWRVWVSSAYYNGFAIYDSVDISADRTDIRIMFHDDRSDRTAKDGWHGFV